MEKTISILNEKGWYRFLKIAYLFFLVASIFGANAAFVAEGIGKIDKDKTLIYCNGGDKRILTVKQVGVYFNNYAFIRGFDYKKFYEGDDNYTVNGILEACYDTPSISDIFLTQRVYEIIGFKDNPKEYDKNYLNEQISKMEKGDKTDAHKASYLDYSVKLFDIKPVYSYKEFLFGLIAINISILVVFEIIRRIFYYMTLGISKTKK